MQPITQASLDPKLNDIRDLRAEQSLDGVIGCFGLCILYRGTTRAFPTSRSGNEFYYDSNSTSSNPAPPLQNSMFSLEKRGFEDDSGDSLDDSPGTKAAHKTTISIGAAPAGMDRHG